MRADYDWSPRLDLEEAILWEGRPSTFKLLSFIACICAFALLARWMALTEIAGAPGGSSCVTEPCPEADRKAGLVAMIWAPTILVMAAAFGLALITSRLDCAVTNERILSLHRAHWRRQPKFLQCPVKDAEAGIHAVFLIVHHKSLPQNLILQAGSKRELRAALALIQRLSDKASCAKPGAS
ncbi:MAG: hypothetical protein U1E06_24800 [Tabrizicola sp.]|nr:hypothetical protein [Tabrizicola sp.]